MAITDRNFGLIYGLVDPRMKTGTAVECVNDGLRFLSMRDAANHYGLNHHYVMMSCRGWKRKNKHHGEICKLEFRKVKNEQAN